jgi:hypothetical protein
MSNTTKRGKASREKPPIFSAVATEINGSDVSRLTIAHAGHGIAELAQELADLHSLCTRLSDAQGPAERACNEAEDKRTHVGEHAECCRAVQDFEEVGRRANGMVEALEGLILTLEPRTPSETLSLALILADKLGSFNYRNIDETDRPAVVEGRRLEDALYAVIRGLDRSTGATSPLADTYSTLHTFTQWAERRAIATREAGLYSITYDPVQGRLRKVGAQP